MDLHTRLSVTGYHAQGCDNKKKDSQYSKVHEGLPPENMVFAGTGMKVKIGCHTFRATGITAYLEAGGTLENAQAMAAHESPRTTKLYDRTGDEITLDEVERITI